MCSGASLSMLLLTLVQEREPLSDVGRVFDVLCAACANVATAMSTAGGSSGQAKTDAGMPRPNGIPPGSPAVTADEMLVEVFSPLAEEAGMDGLYLRAALVEYLRAADAAGVPVPSALPVLLVRVFCWRVLASTRFDTAIPARRRSCLCEMDAPTSYPCGRPCCFPTLLCVPLRSPAA